MTEENANQQNTNHPKKEITHSRNDFLLMIACGLIGMLCWITMFSLGLLINSKPYRDSILINFELKNFLMSVLTFTPTNVAMLCIIAAFSGGCASRLVVAGVAKRSGLDMENPGGIKSDSHLYMMENPFSSMLRGLVVYFAFLAGVFVATPDPFANTSAQQYAQSAGVVSLLSFIVGYDPSVFRSFINLSGKIKDTSK